MAGPTESVRDYGWIKYVWLIYLSFFIIQPIRTKAAWPTLLATGIAVAVFLYLYFAIFRTQGWRQYTCIGCIALLGFLYLPWNWGAANFIIYAAAFIGVATGFVRGVISLSVLLGLTVIEMELLHFPTEAEISVLLAEVRKAIRGYSSGHLASELTRAIDTLDTAGIAVETEWAEVSVSPQQENALALALREAVLNVVRHSRARRCRLRLLAANGVCSLEVHDDGQGARSAEGNGLRGMRERLESTGGTSRKKSTAVLF